MLCAFSQHCPLLTTPTPSSHSPGPGAQPTHNSPSSRGQRKHHLEQRSLGFASLHLPTPNAADPPLSRSSIKVKEASRRLGELLVGTLMCSCIVFYPQISSLIKQLLLSTNYKNYLYTQDRESFFSLDCGNCQPNVSFCI